MNQLSAEDKDVYEVVKDFTDIFDEMDLSSLQIPSRPAFSGGQADVFSVTHVKSRVKYAMRKPTLPFVAEDVRNELSMNKYTIFSSLIYI